MVRIKCTGPLAGALLCCAVLSPLALATDTLSLDLAQTLAASRSETLSAQRLEHESAAARAVAAGELPDPKLILGLENLPLAGADAYSLSRDFMTMQRIGLMQEFPRQAKRKLRADAASAEAELGAAELAVKRLELRRQTAAAWWDLRLAQDSLAALQQLVAPTDLLAQAARARLAGGKGGSGEALAAQSARLALADRLDDARRDLARARAWLVRWVGDAGASADLAAAPPLDRLPLGPEELLASLEQHAQLAVYAPMERRARSEADLARAATLPDWSLEVSYARRGPAYADMLSVMVRMDLPLFEQRRQAPEARAKALQAEQVEARRSAALRDYRAGVESALAEWDAAQRRLTRVQTELLPLARAEAAAALAAYRGARGDLAPAVEAQKREIELQLDTLRRRKELAAAWIALAYLVEPATAGGRP
ncbi:MAG: TolC family protein [Rhodocyclaceae bacterium]|nr:TolC family protein [Rhodocyclaceae bacterium]MBX3667928.1 TolC family protein [Rhodocyclaceae bacterium]